MEAKDPRSLSELFYGLTGDLADLVRKESELVRTELGEKLARLGRAGTIASIGAALMLGGFLVLLQALVLALSETMHPAWASVVVGGAAAVLGLLLARTAISRMTAEELTPERSARQLEKDVQLVKGDLS